MWLARKLRDNKEFDLSILLLQYTGVWAVDATKTPLERVRESAILLSLVFGSIHYALLLPLGAMTVVDNLGEVLECVGIGCIGLIGTVKVASFYLKENSFKELTSRIVFSRRRDMAGQQSKEKQRIVADFQNWTNILVVATSFCVVSFAPANSARLPYMYGDRKYFSKFWFPVDPYTMPTYETMFIVWGFTAAITFAAAASVDGYVAVIFIQIVAQFRLLGYDLSQIREDAIESVRSRCDAENVQENETQDVKPVRIRVSEPLSTKMTKKALKQARITAREKEIEQEMVRFLGIYVDRYQECVQLVSDTEAKLMPMLVIQIIGCVVPLLAAILFFNLKSTAFEGILDSTEREKRRAEHLNSALLYLTVVLSLCMELAVLCYLTDMVTESSDQIRDAIYDCDWFGCSESFKRSMRIVMSRANKPLFVRAAGFLPMTTEFFVAIMNMVYSYYTAMTAAVHRETKN